MNHKLKSLLIVFLLLAVLTAIGFFMGGGITGASTAYSVACFDNSDCNDQISTTEDICKNQGTEYALCINKPKER